MASVPPGSSCSPQEYQRSLHDHTITCLDKHDIVGLTIKVVAGFISLFAILYVVAIIVRNIIWRARHIRTATLRIFHQPIDILVFSLLLADTLQAIGAILSIKWVHDGKTEIGQFCTTQGIIKIFGETGVALSTLSIAMYTYIGVYMVNISSKKITFGVVTGIWVFIAILFTAAFVSHRNENFIAPVPYWCWIGFDHIPWMVINEYFWCWLALFFSILIYVAIYVLIRFNIEFHWSTCSFRRVRQLDSGDPWRRQALVFLAYPAVYCVISLPLTIVRWITFISKAKYGQDPVPSAGTFFAIVLFGLSGFFNVILLLTTRPSTGLFGELMFLSPARPPSLFSKDDDVMDTVVTELGRLPSQSRNPD